MIGFLDGGVVTGVEVVGHEEGLEHEEHDDKFDEDECPQYAPPPGHVPEAVVIEGPYSLPRAVVVLFYHGDKGMNIFMILRDCVILFIYAEIEGCYSGIWFFPLIL